MTPRHRLLLAGSGLLVATLSVSATPQATFGNAIVIRKGGTYRGSWESLDPRVPAVLIETREPVIIENSVIRGRGHLIRGWWMNLTVRNTQGYALNPMTENAAPGRFLLAEAFLNLTIENNLMEGTSGMYIHDFRGDPGKGQTVKILRNRIRNIDGRYVDTSGRPTGERYRVQAVQFNKVRDVPNIEVAWNDIINEPGKSFVEENINIYGSTGTPRSPISVHHNYIQGAYSFDPGRDRVYSGGGIMVGDGDQSSLKLAGGYVNVFRNHVVSTSNQGIAIAGGHNQRVFQNRIVSSGRLPDSTVIPSANVGVYMWDNQGGARRTPKTFFNNSISDNLIGWTRFGPDGRAIDSPSWFPGCKPADGNRCEGNRPWPTPVTLETEHAERKQWLAQVRLSGLQIGPR